MSRQQVGDVVLEVEALTRVFGTGRTRVSAVDGVSFQVRAGEVLLIMGPSGSGKTTLLTMLGALLQPTSGHVRLHGRDITALAGAQLAAVRRHQVGFVFQTFNLLEALSPLENVELALNLAGVYGREAEARAAALLAEAGLGERLHFRTRDLSGGEKQRVSIARALANSAGLILADEPTANLDSHHGRDVMLLLRHMAREEGRTVIIVSHDHRLREIADRVLWLEDGRLKDMGRMAADPVCGMRVEMEGAPSLVLHGQPFYFCSRNCLAEFEADSDRFLAALVAASDHH